MHTRETVMIGHMSASHTFGLSSRIIHIYGASGLDDLSEPIPFEEVHLAFVERISGCPALGVKQSGRETDFSRQASA